MGELLETLETVRAAIKDLDLVEAVNGYSHAEVMTYPYILQALDRYGARRRQQALEPGDGRDLLDVLIGVGVVIERLGLQDLTDSYEHPRRGHTYQDLLRVTNTYSPPAVH